MIMWSLFSNYFFLNHIVYHLRTILRFHLLELDQIEKKRIGLQFTNPYFLNFRFSMSICT